MKMIFLITFILSMRSNMGLAAESFPLQLRQTAITGKSSVLLGSAEYLASLADARKTLNSNQILMVNSISESALAGTTFAVTVKLSKTCNAGYPPPADCQSGPAGTIESVFDINPDGPFVLHDVKFVAPAN